MDKLRMKFSALNVDFNGPSLDVLGSRKPRKSCNEMAGDRPTVWMLWVFAHLVRISSNFLYVLAGG